MLSLATAAALAAPASEGWYGAGAQFGAASSLTPGTRIPSLAMPIAPVANANTQGWSGLKKDKEDVEPMPCGLLYYVHVPKTGRLGLRPPLKKVKHGWGYNRFIGATMGGRGEEMGGRPQQMEELFWLEVGAEDARREETKAHP